MYYGIVITSRLLYLLLINHNTWIHTYTKIDIGNHSNESIEEQDERSEDNIRNSVHTYRIEPTIYIDKLKTLFVHSRTDYRMFEIMGPFLKLKIFFPIGYHTWNLLHNYFGGKLSG